MRLRHVIVNLREVAEGAKHRIGDDLQMERTGAAMIPGLGEGACPFVSSPGSEDRGKDPLEFLLVGDPIRVGDESGSSRRTSSRLHSLLHWSGK